MAPQIFALFLFFVQISFPKPAGFVNDFANVLPVEIKVTLESQLAEYEKQTSIEIAVVTVSSLEGLEIEDYTQQLWESWGVGKSGKDNGIIFITAPNEHNVLIQTGYGIEPDLTDLASSRILDEVVIPFFNNKDVAGGIASGVSAILKSLGNAPYEARLEERRRAEAERHRQRELAAENFKSFIFVIIWILAGLFVFGTPIYLANKYLKNKKRLLELQENNKNTLEKYRKFVFKAHDDESETIIELDLLKNESPKEIWEQLSTRLRDFYFPGLLEKLDIQRSLIDRSNWGGADEMAEKLASISGLIETNTTILRDVKAKREEVKNAQRVCLGAMANLPSFFAKIKIDISHPDVTEETKQIVSDAETVFKQIELEHFDDAINWIELSAIYTKVSSVLEKAEKIIINNKEFAQKARIEGPQLLKTLPINIQNAESKMGHSDISEDSKKILISARQKFNEATNILESSSDWVLIYPILFEATFLVKKAEEEAGNDMVVAKRRREKQLYPTRSSSSSSSQRSSSFRGLGGGRSGGGGASRKW